MFLHNRQRELFWGLLLILLTMVFGALLLATPSQAAPLPQGVPTELPPRPTPEWPVRPTPVPTVTPTTPDADDDDAAVFVGDPSYVKLTFSPVLRNMWAAVQWQDDQGNWHDVEGWQGELSMDGEQLWWVDPSDYGRSGNFRWVVYLYQGGPQIANTYTFYLPGSAGENVHVYRTLRVLGF